LQWRVSSAHFHVAHNNRRNRARPWSLGHIVRLWKLSHEGTSRRTTACTRQGAEVRPLSCPVGRSLRRALQVKPSVVRAVVVATVREGAPLEQCESRRCPSGLTRVAVQHPSSGRGCRAVNHRSLSRALRAGSAAVSLGPTGSRRERGRQPAETRGRTPQALHGRSGRGFTLARCRPKQWAGSPSRGPIRVLGLLAWHPAPGTAAKRGRFLRWPT
jgi:hypothetical protein